MRDSKVLFVYVLDQSFQKKSGPRYILGRKFYNF